MAATVLGGCGLQQRQLPPLSAARRAAATPVGSASGSESDVLRSIVGWSCGCRTRACGSERPAYTAVRSEPGAVDGVGKPCYAKDLGAVFSSAGKNPNTHAVFASFPPKEYRHEN